MARLKSAIVDDLHAVMLINIFLVLLTSAPASPAFGYIAMSSGVIPEEPPLLACLVRLALRFHLRNAFFQRDPVLFGTAPYVECGRERGRII